MGVGKNAANTAIRCIMGQTDCFVKQRLECCRLYSKLSDVIDNRLVKSVFTWSKSHDRCWEKRFLKFIRDIGLLSLFENDYICVETTIKQCRAKLNEVDREKWNSNFFNDTGQVNCNKLRPYRLYKTNLKCEEHNY